MNFGNEQKIENINRSVILQAKDDINIGISARDAMDICEYIVENQLAIYTQAARFEVEKRLSEISEKTIHQIKSLKEDLLHRFRDPAIQQALNETFKNYVTSGDDKLAESLIDLLIERLKVEEKTTEQSIIDEARNIIPKLSSPTVSLLAIMVFSKLVFPYTRKQYNDLIMKLAPIVGNLKNINSLDIAHLKQVGCGSGLLPIQTVEPLEKSLLSNYDLYFRHNVTLREFKDIIQKYSQLTNASLQNNLQENLQDLFSLGDECVAFNVPNSKALTKIFSQASDKQLELLFSDLKNKAIPFTDDEVREYHIRQDTRWQYAFEVFKNKQISAFQLTPVGVFIGIRKLTRICGTEIPISLFYSDE